MNDIKQRFARELGPGGLEARGYVLEVRAATDDNGPQISGLGSPYNETTRIQGWFEEWDEMVQEGAWRKTITRDGADIVSTFNHNIDALLARTTAGTLTLEDPEEGLLYAAEINPDDPQAMSVHAKVARRDVTGSSVWFRVTKDMWEEPTEDNDLEVPFRTIIEGELFEVGPVVFPAFTQTTSEASAAALRGLGHTRASLAAIDGSLRAAGIAKSAKRAAYAARFLADPDTVEDEITELFARHPDLRGRVCETHSCDCDDRAAAAPAAVSPAPAEETPADPPQPQVREDLDPEEVKKRLQKVPLLQQT